MFYRDVKLNNPADYKKFVRKHLPQNTKFIKYEKYVTPDNKYVPTILRKRI